MRGVLGALEGNLRTTELYTQQWRFGMIIKDKKKKKELDRVPDVDQNGDPIYKIAGAGKEPKPKEKERRSK